MSYFIGIFFTFFRIFNPKIILIQKLWNTNKLNFETKRDKKGIQNSVIHINFYQSIKRQRNNIMTFYKVKKNNAKEGKPH